MTGKKFLCVCLSLFVSLAAFSGCAGRQTYNKKYYLLDTTRRGESLAGGTDYILRVSNFTIDSVFSGRGLVYRIDEFRYESDFYNEFLTSPSAMITEKTRNWLAASGLFKRTLDITSRLEPTHIIEGNITALYGDFRDKSSPVAVMEIRIFLLESKAGEEPLAVYGKTYKSSAALESKAPAGLLAAFDKCLENILTDLENDLRDKLL